MSPSFPYPDWISKPPGRVLVVGDAMVDVYLDGKAKGLAREAPVPVVQIGADRIALGGAANAAANLAALGASVRLVGAVGDDSWADRLARAIDGAQVSADLLQVAGRPTTRKVRVRIDDGNLPPRIAFRYDVETDRLVNPADVVLAIERARPAVDAILVSDSGLGVVGPEVVAHMNRIAREVPVFVDSRRQTLLFRGVAAIAPNDLEAADALGYAIESDDEARRAVADLAARTTSGAVLMTRGARGVAAWADGRATIVPAASDEPAVDTTGAGDSATAAFMAARLSGATVLEAAAYANLAGAIAVRSAGTVVVTHRALAQAFQAQRAGAALSVA